MFSTVETTATEPTTIETYFKTRQECVSHWRPFFEAQVKHELRFARKKFNEYSFILVCKDCGAMVARGYCSRSAKTDNTFKLENYNLKPRHYNQELNQWCEPTGKKKSTIKELACSEILNMLVNDHKLSKGAKRGVSAVAKQSLLALTGHGSVSISAIKHATALLKGKHCGKHVAVNNRKHALSAACIAHSDKHKEGSLNVNNLTSTLNDSRAVVLCDDRDEYGLDISDYA